jgi:hypothetical protein
MREPAALEALVDYIVEGGTRRRKLSANSARLVQPKPSARCPFHNVLIRDDRKEILCFASFMQIKKPSPGADGSVSVSRLDANR